MSKNVDKNDELELYTDKQNDAIEKHIEEHFGKIKSYFSEKTSEYIQINIHLVPPTKEKPYYILVTSGMGAHKMNVPEGLEEKHLERAELILCLPPDCNIDEEDTEYKWALNLMSMAARLPIRENAWLGWGHSIDYGGSFIGDDGFSSVMMIFPMFSKESMTCTLPDGEIVNFYQILPLYPNELTFKNIHNASELIRKFSDDELTVADPMRKCVIPDNFTELLDTVKEHSDKIIEKNLDLLEINGANHIAAFLRWSLENNMLNDDFLDFFAEDIEQIQNGSYDIRKFLINSLDGELTTDIYNNKGARFCEYYYDHYHDEDEPCYPADVDKMALEYFGEERYNSDEFQDEAYLFVPFDEDYYKAMSSYIESNYKKFLEHEKEEADKIIDFYYRHAYKIEEKELDIPMISAANHIAAFLKWCIEHDLMCEDFVEFYSRYADDIESGELDIRDFLINNLDEKISTDMFNDCGQAFIKHYYIFGYNHDYPTYPSDVDKMAMKYFGKKKYNSKEFQDEAYLFVPFDDKYYKSMSKYIDKSYKKFIDSIAIDCYADHAKKIDEKKLDTDRLNAVNHIAAFLKWCIENNLVSEDFMICYSDFQEDIESGKLDIREFFVNNFDGVLSNSLLSEKGRLFAEFYYSFTCEPPSYPDDVDKMALSFFGKRKYKSKKFQDEAYLFVPFDENYCTTMSRYIDHAYSDFCYFLEYGKLPD